ncbi:MAG: hypothetical protein V1872_12435 [bacterium]
MLSNNQNILLLKRLTIISLLNTVLILFLYSFSYGDDKPLKYIPVVYRPKVEISLSYPTALYFHKDDKDKGILYVLDSGNRRTLIYKISFEIVEKELSAIFYEDSILRERDGLTAPVDIAVGKDGLLYVSQQKTQEKEANISIFNTLGGRDEIGLKEYHIDIPGRLDVDKNGNIYLCKIADPGIVIFNKEKKLIKEISPEIDDEVKPGEKTLVKVDVTNCHLDEKGNFYLISKGYGKTFVYNHEYKLLKIFGEKVDLMVN